MAGAGRLDEPVPYLVDGNNLGGALAGPDGARDRETVVRWVLDWSRSGRRAVLVFDGPEDPSLALGYGRVHLRFSGSRTADSLVREMVRADAARWIVVTDDGNLRRDSIDAGARVVSARELVRAVAAEGPPGEPSPGKPEGPVDVEEWLEFFEKREE